MEFAFDFDYRIDGWKVAEFSGVAVLEAAIDGPAPGAEFASWFVSEVRLAGTRGTDGRFERDLVTLPDDHPLHDRLLTDIINQHRADIDRAWDAHMSARIGAARKAFRLVSANA